MKIRLGEPYKDSATGFVGTATGTAKYLSGAKKVLLESKSNNNSKPTELWFDMKRLVPEIEDETPKLGFTKPSE